MKITPLALDGIMLVEGPVFEDARGAFLETWREDRFGQAGMATNWQQDNLSRSRLKGTIRGLHWQMPPFAQAKLVRVITGRILDVIVDIRRGSQTFGQAIGVELSGDVNQALLVPVGFAHGFCTLVDNTVVTYKTSAVYDPSSERSLRWASPDLNIAWPVNTQDAIISEKDGLAPVWADLAQEDLF
jgi:dTDP-4-dehydrorhamnose 3,5-epimerase